jgi:hypothetical protein
VARSVALRGPAHRAADGNADKLLRTDMEAIRKTKATAGPSTVRIALTRGPLRSG